VADGTLVQGDLYIATSTDTMGRLAAGAANQALVMNGAGTLPEWGSAAASAIQRNELASDQTTTSATAVTITGFTRTLGASGNTFAVATVILATSSTGSTVHRVVLNLIIN